MNRPKDRKSRRPVSIRSGVTSFFAGLLLLVLNGCSSTETAPITWEPILADVKIYFDSLATAFESIHDEESATEKLPELLKILDTGRELQRRINEFRVSEDDQQINDSFTEEIGLAVGLHSRRMYDHTKILRVNLQVMDILKPYLDRVNGRGNNNTRRGEHLI